MITLNTVSENQTVDTILVCYRCKKVDEDSKKLNDIEECSTCVELNKQYDKATYLLLTLFFLFLVLATLTTIGWILPWMHGGAYRTGKIPQTTTLDDIFHFRIYWGICIIATCVVYYKYRKKMKWVRIIVDDKNLRKFF